MASNSTPSFAITSDQASKLKLTGMKAGDGIVYSYNPGGNKQEILVTTSVTALQVAEKFRSADNPKYKDWEILAMYMQFKTQ